MESIQEIEEEKKEKLEMIAQRRDILNNNYQQSLKALKTVKESMELNNRVREFNDSIEILRELMEGLMKRFERCFIYLEKAMSDEDAEIQAKECLRILKKKIMGIEEQLKIVERNQIEKRFEIGKVNEIMKLVNYQIEDFLLIEKFEYNAIKTGNVNMLTANFEKHLTNIGKEWEPKWDHQDIKDLRESMNIFSKEIDNIGFASSNLRETLYQMINSSMSIE